MRTEDEIKELFTKATKKYDENANDYTAGLLDATQWCLGEIEADKLWLYMDDYPMPRVAEGE